MPRNWFANEMAAVAARFGLDPMLLEAVAWQESSCRTNAYRYEPLFWDRYLAKDAKWANANPFRVSASYGLLQIMFPVAQELGFIGKPEELFDPETGLEWGARKLASLVAWAKGDIEMALAAYNGGKGGNATRPFRNGTYATNVLARLKFLKGQTE